MFRRLLARVDARVWMLLLALAAGGAAAWMAHRYLAGVAEQLAADSRQATTSAVVAAGPLAAGMALAADTAALREVPSAWLPSDALLPADFEAVAGASLLRGLAAGEVVRWSDLELTARASFSSRLAPGRRAVTIPVDEINSLSGLLEPGDIVDLYVSFDHVGRRITRLLLAEVRVLATGRQHADAHQGDARAYATVTLDAAPADAVRLLAARQQGSIAAMLRRPGDADPALPSDGGDLASLLGLPAPPSPRRAVPVVFGNRAPLAMPGLDGEMPAPAVFVPGMPAPADMEEMP